MTIGLFPEGDLEQIVLPILLRGILRQRFAISRVQGRGVGNMERLLPAAFEKFHRVGVTAVVIALDNEDRQPVHAVEHHRPDGSFPDARCIFCRFQRLSQKESRRLRANFHYAVAVSVQALESWMIFGASGRKHHPYPEVLPKAELKPKLYGTSHPTLDDMVRTCKPIARRLITEMRLSTLAKACPSFGFFMDQVNSWRIPSST